MREPVTNSRKMRSGSSWDTGEFPSVVGDKNPSFSAGMRREPKIVVANDRTASLQDGTNLAVVLASRLWQSAGWDQPFELLDGRHRPFARLALLSAEAQFAQRDDRHRKLVGRMASKVLAHGGRVVLGDVERPDLTQRPFRINRMQDRWIGGGYL